MNVLFATVLQRIDANHFGAVVNGQRFEATYYRDDAGSINADDRVLIEQVEDGGLWMISGKVVPAP